MAEKTASFLRPSAGALSASGFSRGGGLLLAFHLGEALLQRRHQIHHWSELLGLLDFSDLSPFQFGLNEVFDVVLEGVVIFLRVPLGSEGFNQLVGNFYFGVF